MSDTALAVAPANQASVRLLDIIQFAVTNPEVDIAKMRVLMEMQERSEERDAKRLYMAAFAAMQGELPTIVKDGRIDLGSGKGSIPFATFESVMAIVAPKLRAHGFSYSFTSEDSEKAGVLMTLTIRHQAGHAEDSTMRLPSDPGPSRPDGSVKAIGSARSYAKRYLILDMLSIVTVNEDDDGQGATYPPITRNQQDQIADLLITHGVNKAAFLKWAGVQAIADIPTQRFDEVVRAIKAKGQAK